MKNNFLLYLLKLQFASFLNSNILIYMKAILVSFKVCYYHFKQSPLTFLHDIKSYYKVFKLSVRKNILLLNLMPNPILLNDVQIKNQLDISKKVLESQILVYREHLSYYNEIKHIVDIELEKGENNSKKLDNDNILINYLSFIQTEADEIRICLLDIRSTEVYIKKLDSNFVSSLKKQDFEL